MLERGGKLSKSFPPEGSIHATRKNRLQFPAQDVGRADQSRLMCPPRIHPCLLASVLQKCSSVAIFDCLLYSFS